MNTKKVKQLVTILMAVVLTFMTTGMARASSVDKADNTILKTKSSQEYDNGIIPLNDLGKDYVFYESDFTNKLTAPIPTYIHIDDDIHVTKSSQEYDDGIVSLGEVKLEKDYTEWTAEKPTYIRTEDISGTTSKDSNEIGTKDVGETEDSNSNPPSSEDTTLPDTSYFRTNDYTY